MILTRVHPRTAFHMQLSPLLCRGCVTSYNIYNQGTYVSDSKALSLAQLRNGNWRRLRANWEAQLEPVAVAQTGIVLAMCHVSGTALRPSVHHS